MAKTVLNVKTDVKVKQEVQRLARELGVPLSTIINAQLKNFIREKQIILSLYPRLRPEQEMLLDQIEKDIQENKNLSKPFKTAEEMDRYLNSL